MAGLVFLGFFVLLGAAVILGYTFDSRDPEYSLGRVFDATWRKKDTGAGGGR